MSGNTVKESLTTKIYNCLLNKILSNELAPGTVINRKALAEEYGVSMAPIREALLILSQEGFIEIRSRSVTIVKAVQKEDILGILTLREALESQTARIICGNIIRDNYDRLLSQANRLDQSADQMSYWHEDVQFHRQLVRLSNCPLLINTYNQIMNVGNFYKINSYFLNDDPDKRMPHSTLLEDLLTDDPDFAEKKIRFHLQAGKNNL